MSILLWVWTYFCKKMEGELNKDSMRSHDTYNGGSKFHDKSTITKIYMTCVKQPIQAIIWTTFAVLNLICKGYDVGNSFAEAPTPTFKFYM